MKSTPKTALCAMVSAIALILAAPAPLISQGTPNAADANLLSEAFPLPDTNLVIDVPMAWRELPTELFGPGLFDGWLSTDTEDEDILATFGGSAPNQGGFGVMLISRADEFTRPPLAEIRTIEQGIKLSRIATWIVGSGMAIMRPARPFEIEGGTAATLSFLSGPEDAHDLVTITLIHRAEDRLMIVDIAPKDSEEAIILDQMRATLRPQ